MDFTYKGTTASSLGVILNSLEWFKKPNRRVDQLSINGKDGATVVDNAYGALSLRCRITMTSTTNMSSVLAWLTGNGVLSFSEDSGKYRNAYVLDEVEFRRRGSIWEASFDFFCADPYRYVASEANVTKTTFPASYTNAGTVIAKPLWKVTGSGTVSFTSGGKTMTLVLDTAYVYVDADSKEVYYLTTLKNRIASGDFPELSVGANTISITGTVTEIVITPRTRYL